MRGKETAILTNFVSGMHCSDWRILLECLCTVLLGVEKRCLREQLQTSAALLSSVSKVSLLSFSVFLFSVVLLLRS
jgi:hypothetical protein